MEGIALLGGYCLVRSRGPVPVARSRWPGSCAGVPAHPFLTASPVPQVAGSPLLEIAVAQWPGLGIPGARPRCPVCPAMVAGGPVPVHHLCSVASFSVAGMDAQSLPGIWLFSKPLVRGKQYCELGTIIRQKQGLT